MPNIEIEIRSFITQEQYKILLEFFKHNAKLIKKDYQETSYFDSEKDLRIQKNNFYAKVWMKEGAIHDEAREEIEIKVDRNDFEKLEQLFLALGFNVKIKWFRNRTQFDWHSIKVCLDYTKGYGHIIELEVMGSEDQKESILNMLKQKLQTLNITQTPREEFDTQFKYYSEHWRELV